MSIIQPDQIKVQNNATEVALRPILNYQPGTNVSFSIVDDPANNRVNILINATSSGTVGGTGTDNRLARWDGTTNIQDSGITLDDSNNITGVTSLTASSVTIGALAGVLKASAGVVSGSATTSDLPEGTNLYYTQARFDTAFGLKSTTDLAEGTNLYYTAARFNTAFSGKTTTDLTEGTNLYFTNARAISATAASYGPINAPYLTVGGDATLTGERAFSVVATNLTFTDLGANNTYSINTIQNIDTTATPTFQRVLVTGSTNQRFFQGDGTLDAATGDENAYQFNYTVNKATSGTTRGLSMDMTDTSSPGTAYLADFLVGGTSKWRVDSDGFVETFREKITLGTTATSTALDVSSTITGTASANYQSLLATATCSPSAASSASVRAADFITGFDAASVNNVTNLIGIRSFVQNNNSAGGTVTGTLQGVAMQAILGPLFGTGGTAYAANVNGTVLQAAITTNTATTIASAVGANFAVSLSGTATVTAMTNALLGLAQSGGTCTTGRIFWGRTSGIFGNTLSGGTMTNAILIDIEGFPTGGTTFTNTTEQVRIQAGSRAGIAVRQLGVAGTVSRFQSPICIGADADPTATYVIDVRGNLSTSATVFNFTTVTSLTMQDVLARPLLFFDATNIKLQTNPVTIIPTLVTSGAPGPSLTITSPAHTGLTAAANPSVIFDLDAEVQFTSGSFGGQNAILINSPTYSMTAIGTITSASTMYIGGPPDADSTINLNATYGLYIGTRAMSTSVLSAIGLVVESPTSSVGGANIAAAAFTGSVTGKGIVGIGTLTPRVTLDITPILSSASPTVTTQGGLGIGCSVFMSVEAVTVPTASTQVFLADLSLNPSASHSSNSSALTGFLTLKGTSNFTGAPRIGNFQARVQSTAGTITSIIGVSSAIVTESTAASTITLGRGYLASATIQGATPITTFVNYDASYTSSAAQTTTDLIYFRVVNPALSGSAAVTSVTGLLIPDISATATNKYGVRQQGITGQQNRFAAQTRFGSDTAPTRSVDINGGLAINSSGSLVNLTADNQVVTVGDRSYIRLESDNATATNRTFVLTQSTTSGHILVLEWTDTQLGELVDDSAQNGGGNHRLSATWSPNQNDTLTLISNGTNWIELARSAN